MADGVADAQAGHAVRLRERPRDDDARVLDRQRDVRLVIRIGDVVEVRLVDEDRGVGRVAVDPREEVARRARADVGGRRVVRDCSRTPARRPSRRRRTLSRSILKSPSSATARTGCPISVGVAGALLVGRDRADERLVLRREDVRARAEDLRRAAAEDDVLGLDAVLLGDARR